MGKRARERARIEKKAAKQERREALSRENDATNSAAEEAALMEEFARLSERHDADEITQEDYDEERLRIFTELGIASD